MYGRSKNPGWGLALLAFPIVLGLLINFHSLRRVSATVTQHQVGKLVTEFPEQLDLSSPATASAAMWRAYARMDTQTISQISIRPINPGQYQNWFENEQRRDREGMTVYLKAKIVTVQTWRDALASVITYLPFPAETARTRYSNQYFLHEDGQWKYLWQEGLPDLATAKLRMELEEGKKSICMLINSLGDETDKRSATSPAEVQLMERVQFNFVIADPNIAFRKSIQWGDVRTNLDGSRSIRYKYQAELWKGGMVTNDEIFTISQYNEVSKRGFSPQGGESGSGEH
jgi:hypothetical protein